MAKQQCKSDPASLAAWMPIIRSYAHGLLTQCMKAKAQSVEMVSGWLQRFMLADHPDREGKSKEVANWFTNYENFGSHGERVGRDESRAMGLKVEDLENDQQLQDTVLSIHHATMHTFSGTGAVKIIENHHGRAWIRSTPRAVRVPTTPGNDRQRKPAKNRRQNNKRRKK